MGVSLATYRTNFHPLSNQTSPVLECASKGKREKKRAIISCAVEPRGRWMVLTLNHMVYEGYLKRARKENGKPVASDQRSSRFAHSRGYTSEARMRRRRRLIELIMVK